MNPATIKKHVLEAIPNQIGTYTYVNGYQGVAIAIGNPPNDITVSGVEVIIPNFPTISKSHQYGYTHHRCERWKLVVINHGQSKDNWFTAIDRILRYFPNCSGVDIPQSDPLKSLPMYVITVSHGDGYEGVR